MIVHTGVGVVLGVVVGLIFATSAVPKLRYPQGFMLAVLAYHVLPLRMGRLYARLLPPLELLIALLLMSGTAMRSASIAAAALLLSFLIAVGINVARGRDLDCHCFGRAARRPIGWGLMLQDSVLLGATIVLATNARAWVTPESWSVFHLFGLAQAGSVGPFLSCVALLAGTMVLSGASKSMERRYRHASVRRDQ